MLRRSPTRCRRRPASELESVAVPLGDGKPAPGAPLDDAGAAHDNPAMDEEYKSQLEAEERRYKRLEEKFRKQHGVAE